MKWDAASVSAIRILNDKEIIDLISLYYKENKYPIYKIKNVAAANVSSTTDYIVEVIEERPAIAGHEIYGDAKYYLLGIDFQLWLNKKKITLI